MAHKVLVAIHQPTFFPWLGYFNKLKRADIFISLDNVQFPKSGAGTWMNRVQLVVGGQAAWVTVPVVRSYHGTRLIKEMQINNSTNWREKLLRTVQMNYAHSPFFKSIFPFFSELVNNPTDSLADYNEAAIRAIAGAIGLNTSRFVNGSALNSTGTATDLLISMVHATGGTAYLCGGGAGGYQEDDKFTAAGIELIYQNFVHPVYVQCNTAAFVPGLSIIDVLMNLGFKGAKSMLANNASVSS